MYTAIRSYATSAVLSPTAHIQKAPLAESAVRLTDSHVKAMQGSSFMHTTTSDRLEKVMPGVAYKTWEPLDESLKNSGVIQKTAERIIQVEPWHLLLGALSNKELPLTRLDLSSNHAVSPPKAS